MIPEDIPVENHLDSGDIAAENQDPVSQENVPESEESDSEENLAVAVARELGKTPSQIMEIVTARPTPHFTYYWQQDRVIISDDYLGYIYIFSDSAEPEDAVCIAIGMNAYDLLPKDHKGFDASADDLPVYWRAKEIPSSDAGRREYRFAGNILVVYLDEDGGFLSQSPNAVIEKTASVDVRLSDFLNSSQKTSPAPFNSAGEYGERIGRYAECIGRHVYEINADMSLVGEGPLGGQLYEADGIQYLTYLFGDEGICQIVFAPASRIFETQSYIDADYLKTKVGADFSWRYFERYSYIYNFEDIVVYIDADSSGIISPDGRVMIKKR
jgi:hypothetical protein